MTNMLIDTHAHLDFPDFANDLQDVLGRADEAGVRRIITIGTSIETQPACDRARGKGSIFVRGDRRSSQPRRGGGGRCDYAAA